MSNIISFPISEKAKLILNMKASGKSDSEIESALIRLQGPELDPEPPRPKKRVDPNNVVELKIKEKTIGIVFLKAA